jgi:tRNA modification GTPase
VSDTIFALSSGALPAGIAVLRVSGPEARSVAERLCGLLGPPRTLVLRDFRDPSGELIDRGLLVFFPGPATATGEELVEFHCHGSRAVVARMKQVLGAVPGLRQADPGEFTRRALFNGRLDLTEAEGLADLLAAETEWQRRAAIVKAGGELSRKIEYWRWPPNGAGSSTSPAWNCSTAA